VFNTILLLAPHTDDGELGCGGSISKWIKQGKEIYYVAFSTMRKVVPPGMNAETFEQEIKESTQLLSIKPANLILFGYPVRDFATYRQQILDNMVRINSEVRPDLVLLPSTDDTHQDHQTISQEGFRAFKKTSIMGYEVTPNNLNFHTHLFSLIDRTDVEKKIASLMCYKSQADKTYLSADFVTSLARVRGAQIGQEYAEAFEVIRWIIK
jgi:LmbE family N-acetylglucosaminyl deacetylase